MSGDSLAEVVKRRMRNRRKMATYLKETSWLREGWRSPEVLEAVVDSLSEGITVVNRDLNYVEVNDSWLRIHGFTDKSEMLGKSAFELVSMCHRQRVEAGATTAVEKGTSRGIQLNLLRKDGSQFPAEVVASVVRNKSNTPVGFVTVTRDLTAHRRAEDELRVLNRRLVQMREEEPRTVTRDLRDQIGQSLTAIKIALDLSTQCVSSSGWPALRSAQSLGEFDPYDSLTSREREVLYLVVRGYSNAKAAHSLYISKRTVDGHRARLMRKLGVKNHTELLHYAILRGILPATK